LQRCGPRPESECSRKLSRRDGIPMNEKRQDPRASDDQDLRKNARLSNSLSRNIPIANAWPRRPRFRAGRSYTLSPARACGRHPPLAESFVIEPRSTMGRPAAGILRDARARLLAYAWLGNVRELLQHDRTSHPPVRRRSHNAGHCLGQRPPLQVRAGAHPDTLQDGGSNVQQ